MTCWLPEFKGKTEPVRFRTATRLKPASDPCSGILSRHFGDISVARTAASRDRSLRKACRRLDKLAKMRRARARESLSPRVSANAPRGPTEQRQASTSPTGRGPHQRHECAHPCLWPCHDISPPPHLCNAKRGERKYRGGGTAGCPCVRARLLHVPPTAASCATSHHGRGAHPPSEPSSSGGCWGGQHRVTQAARRPSRPVPARL